MSPSLPPQPSAKPAYYPALTGIRGVAAYLVFFVHFRPPGTPELVGRVLTTFYVTLSMFFVLSGFVLATRYQGSGPFTRPWWRSYLWQRVARIYPAYLLLNSLALARLYLPLPPGRTANSLLLIFLSETLLRGFSNTLKYVGLPQGWSLTPEECFYFTLPLLLLLWRRRSWPGALAFGAAALALGAGLTLLCRGHVALHGLFGTWHQLVNFTFFGRVLEFSLGVALARWWQGRPQQSRPGTPWRTIGGVVFVALTIAALAWIDSPQTPYDGNVYPSTIALNTVAFPLGMTLLFAGLLAESTWLRTFLATPVVHAIGHRSYFFYLLHVGVFSIWWHDTFGGGRHIILQFLATIVLAEIGHRFFERPVHRWILARTVGRKTAPG